MEILVTKGNGNTEALDVTKITRSLEWAAGAKFKHYVPELELASKIHFYDGIKTSFIMDIMIKTSVDMSSLKAIGFDTIAKNLMVQRLYKQVCGSITPTPLYDILTRGVNLGVYAPRLLSEFTAEDIEQLEGVIDYTRDFNFTASGIDALQLKYMKRHSGKVIELPQHMFMIIAMDIFYDYHVDRISYIKKMYNKLSTFKITLPTPEMTALGTLSTDYASCVLLQIGDSLGSWIEASKAIVLETSASAGIGCDISSLASIGDQVKNNTISHGGKVPELRSIDTDIQKTTQNGRRGAATAFVNFFDPEIITILSIKSPRTEVAKRINDLSYGIKLRELVYERAAEKRPISLFSNRCNSSLQKVFHAGTKEEFRTLYEKLEADMLYTEQIDARYFLEVLNTECLENSAYYIMNVDEVNANSPYVETIYQSNICMEEVSPTKPVSPDRPNEPDIAICVLSNVNQALVSIDELDEVTDLIVRAQTHIMVRQVHPMSQATAYVNQYLSIGIGLSNHAYWLASMGYKYGDQAAMEAHDLWMENFQFGLMSASTNLAKEIGAAPRFFEYSTYAKGVMPFDRYKRTVDELVPLRLTRDWDTLREDIMHYGMANVALSMVPPSESSSVPSGQTSGLEAIKDLITYKETKAGINKQFAPNPLKLADKYDYAYLTKDMTKRYFKHVAITQKWVDKAISANRWYNPELYADKKVPLKVMLDDMFFAKYYGVKTIYYTNTYIDDVEEKQGGCVDGGCSV